MKKYSVFEKFKFSDLVAKEKPVYIILKLQSINNKSHFQSVSYLQELFSKNFFVIERLAPASVQNVNCDFGHIDRPKCRKRTWAVFLQPI